MARNNNRSTNNYGISKAISGSHKRGKATVCYETHQFFESAVITAEVLGVSYTSLVAHLEGKSESVSGFHCRYVEDTASISAFYSERRRKEQEAALAREAARQEAEAEAKAQREAIEAAKEIIRKANRKLNKANRKLKKLS